MPFKTHFSMTRFFQLPAALLKNATLLILTVLILGACRSNKDLLYMRDAQPSRKMAGLPQVHSDYKIKINDNLFVSIVSSNIEMNEIYNPSTVGMGRTINNLWQSLQGQFLYGYLVDAEGSIALPALGKVNVVGLTLPECEAKIKAKAEEYLKEVTTKVRLLNYKITVMGEVTTPGVYYNFNPEFTIFDALGSAGGATPSAKLNKVMVLRREGDGSRTITIDLSSHTALASDGYFLEPNDVVVVSPAKYRNAQLGLPFYSSLLSTVTTFILVLNYIK
jgi:polysaccharide export outer membrane protein